jgi:DNA-directed RNA polymerase specialized sigma24 family protein
MSVVDRSFDDFVGANARELMSTAFLICCNETDAEDLVQECLWRVARRWRRAFRGQALALLNDAIDLWGGS